LEFLYHLTVPPFLAALLLQLHLGESRQLGIDLLTTTANAIGGPRRIEHLAAFQARSWFSIPVRANSFVTTHVHGHAPSVGRDRILLLFPYYLTTRFSAKLTNGLTNNF
jgi:hypothetical protein